MENDYVLPDALAASATLVDFDDFEMVPNQSHPGPREPPPTIASKERYSAAGLSPEQIQESVKNYLGSNITGRPIRIYVNGFYDLFHAGHALQLRQAKLSFPSVHLMVGVFSDALCKRHGCPPVLDRIERMEVVRHCRWVDEVLPEAPWVIDESFLEKWDVDYVAFAPGDAGGEFGYDIVKKLGKALMTTKTGGVSSQSVVNKAGLVYVGRQRDNAVVVAHPAETVAPEPAMDIFGIGI